MKFALKMLSTAAIAIFPLLADAGAIDQLHQFLNNTRTLKADFSQIVVGKGGRKPQQSSGTVSISRPGKLRWDIQNNTIVFPKSTNPGRIRENLDIFDFELSAAEMAAITALNIADGSGRVSAHPLEVN